jgi:hypothetical protein
LRIDDIPQRHHDRRNPQVGDHRALQPHDQDAGHERREPDHNNRHARDRQRSADRGENADQGTDRNIDIAGYDHHRHPDCRHRDIGVAKHDVGEVSRRQKARVVEADQDRNADDRERQQGLLRSE